MLGNCEFAQLMLPGLLRFLVVLCLTNYQTHIADMLEVLSQREMQLLRYLQAGKSNRQIAADAGVKEETVKFHLKNVYRKLGLSISDASVNKRTAAVVIAQRGGLLDLPGLSANG